MMIHANSNAGGGGERVLWLAIQALADLHDKGLPLHIFIYTGDLGVTSEEILKRAEVSKWYHENESQISLAVYFTSDFHALTNFSLPSLP